MSDPLIVVDVQRGFLNPYTAHVPSRIRQLIAEGDYGPLYFTRFLNTPDSPYRRLLDWHACQDEPDTELAPELGELVARGTLFDKHGLTGLPSELRETLRASGVQGASVAGIDTDMCVLKTSLDLFDLGIEPFVLVDCCASTAGLQAHLAGLAVLCRTIGSLRLRETGLGGSYLGAPPD